MPDSPQPVRLVCAECGRESDDQAHGWRALVLSDDDEHPLQDDQVAVWCPECAARDSDGTSPAMGRG